ncbi:MAG: glycosyltransferase family 2 protein, partial [Flavobacterium sp.]
MKKAMEQMPVVSVVIPYFNREKAIFAALQSVANQSFNSWECLVVDDGSTNESLQQLNEILKEISNPAIQLLHRPLIREKGANACRNVGVESANGKYIAFLDSDDRWPEDYLLSALNFAQTQKSFFGCYSGAIIQRAGQTFTQQSRAIKPNEGLFDFILAPDVVAQTSSYFVLRECALNVKFDEKLKRHQDYDYFIRFGKQYSWLFNPISKTYIDWSTISSRKTDFFSCIQVYNRHKSEFKNNTQQEGYLISILGLALRENAAREYIRFYQRELRSIG